MDFFIDFQLLSIHPSDSVWIGIAFACGFLVKQVGLPPLIGFLAAGFVLNTLGAEGGEFLDTAADLGITLLLFSVGLKLKPIELVRPEVWGVATVHMSIVTFMVAVLVFLLAQTNLPLFANLDFGSALLIGFALSFSSTVFAIKILDELGATSASHGKTAIGVLVVQDVFAVVFLAISIGKTPSIWALLLLLLIILRPLFQKLLTKTDHGELLILFGIVMALGGEYIFEIAGIKGDVGALIFGMLLASHPKSNELAKALLSFKDLFLVGFFLSVGMAVLPGWYEVLIALFFIIFLPIKVLMYFGLFNLFYLRSSTSWRTSLNLANYSEFGLIVGAVAVSAGWLANEWLAVFAVVLSFSFILSAPLVNVRDAVYQSWRPMFKRFERKKRLFGDEDLDLLHVKVVIFGMGRVGTGAYNAIKKDFADYLVGVEIDQTRADKHQSLKRNVIVGDATSADFWTRTPSLTSELEWVLLALPSHNANMAAALQLKELGYQGRVISISRYKDEEKALKSIGVDCAFNIYAEAGLGIANELKNLINQLKDDDPNAKKATEL